MATDGLSLFASIWELQTLVGARIDKIQQPNKDVLLLHLHGSSCGRVKLMLNIHNENGRIQLTEQLYDNPEVAPAFCMLLRKHLTGCRIASLTQTGLDRVAVFSLYGKNELQDEIQLKLIVELMGKHGNVFLIDSDGIILDCMRHFGIGETAARVCLPNCPYVDPPKKNRLHPFAATESQLSALAGGRLPHLWMSDALDGISKLCSHEICSDDTPPHQIVSACMAVFAKMQNKHFSPSVIPSRGVLPFVPNNSAAESYFSMQAAQEAFYRQRDEQMLLTRQRSALRATADQAYKRVLKKLETNQMQIQDKNSAEQDKRFGELLTANPKVLQGSGSSVVVIDYYADPPCPIEIPIDARYSIQQNAQRYFKRYRKAKAARAYALSRQSDLAEERDYLESVLLSIEQCSAVSELNELREELTAQGYWKSPLEKHSKPTVRKSEPICYISQDQTIILVGKNNRQNEQLLRTESPDFYWLHAKDVAASHVYIESEAPSRETLLLAAEIAALHSRSARGAKIPVDYTLRRYVKKPSGARPGFVTYSQQHTLYVTPNAEKLASFRKKES